MGELFTDFLKYLPAIITAIAGFAWNIMQYRQYSKNKMTDLKIEQWKKEQEETSARRSSHVANIYGELWQLLHYLKADRVYITQPHPLTNSLFVSITLEVKRNGVSEIKSSVRNLKLSTIANFGAQLAKNEVIVYKNVDTEMKDKRAKSIMQINGSQSVIIQRLSDENNNWIGNIFVDFTTHTEVNLIYAKKLLKEAADNIQYVLPEFKQELS